MEIITKLFDDTVIVEYKLTEKEMRILQYVKENGRICFRNSFRFEDKPDDSGQFKKDDCNDLLDNVFLEYDDDAWHTEYKLTVLAKKVLNA
jgi:hypothetical protein